MPATLLERILQGDSPEQLLAAFPALDFSSAAFVRQLKTAEDIAAQGPEVFDFSAQEPRLQAGQQTYSLGYFSLPSLAELKRQLAPNLQARLTPRLSIILGASRLSDIQYLEAHADGDTLFQLASQFNGLEAPSATLVPVAEYFGDHTQGPLGVLPVFQGALLRHYAAPGADGKRFIQNSAQQLNFLADVLPPAIGQVSNGYLQSQHIRQPQALAQKLSTDFDLIRIGLHRQLRVIGSDGTQLDQVLTSTLAGGAYSQADTRQEPWLTIQRQLLRAAYLGTLLAAVASDKHKVVLTAIGGGVFANPHSLIWEAILWSLKEIGPYLKAPLHVILNLRSFELPLSELQAQTQRYQGRLIQL